nr:MAG TPA: Bifunctional DNA primase polymerase [Caudoviricetes sp.]
MAETTMLDAALSYAHLGLAVFPLVEGAKNPATAKGFKNASTDEKTVRTWWTRNPNYNIGIACGNGTMVIDLDVDEAKDEDGTATLRKWEDDNGKLPETATAVTGRGGLHMLYRIDGEVRCSANPKLGVDVRGDGGYIVAPPSIHPNGTQYAWERDPRKHEIAEADGNVMAFIEFVQGKKDDESNKALSVPGEIESGGRNNTLFKMACSLQSKGLSNSAILAAVMAENAEKCNPPLSNNEVRRLVESALTKEKGNAEDPTKIKVALSKNENGKPHQSISNCIKAIERDDRLAGRFRFNVIAYTKTLTLPVPWDDGEGERPIADWDYCGLASFLERRYGLMSKQKAIDAVTEVSMHNRYNPITSWMDGLEWDGEPRMDTLLPCFLGTDMSDYNVAVMRLFMMGAVARAYEPGTKFDYMPVLIGPQGLGKSFFLRKLGHCSDWYCDNFNTIEGDAAAEKLRGLWIVEMAELLAAKKQRDVESIKAFLTSQVDTIRPKYARETEQRPRACVFAGTTNNPHFLTDTTGNRRFLPVECGINEPAMSLFADGADGYFEQAWAEAVHVYKTERPVLVLDERSAAFAMEKQEQYLEDDPRVGMVQQYLDEKLAEWMAKPQRRQEDVRVCAQELIQEALTEEQCRAQSRFLVNEMHSIMQNKIEGWVKYPKNNGRAKTSDYGVQRCYIPLAVTLAED